MNIWPVKPKTDDFLKFVIAERDYYKALAINLEDRLRRDGDVLRELASMLKNGTQAKDVVLEMVKDFRMAITSIESGRDPSNTGGDRS